MTDHNLSPASAPDLRLQSEPPRVMRLSRKALGLLGGLAGIGVGALLIYGLQAPDGDRPEELYGTEGRAAVDAIAGPKYYDDIPQLGPPLPGDLGRPILKSGGDGMLAATDEERERAKEAEAARLGDLFARIRGKDAGVETRPDADGAPDVRSQPLTAAVAQPGDALLANVAASAGDPRRTFLDAPPDRRTLSDERLIDPASPYALQAGSVIPAALITGIRSDLPGQVAAQVTANVYDSLTGRTLLIPQGARLIGLYDAQVSFGQRRVLLVWTRLILPNGRSIVLDRLPAADLEGYAGLEDDVDHHWGRLFMAAGLSTLLGVGAELGSNDDSDIARAIRDSGQATVGRTGDDIVRRQIEVAPTLTIRAGFPVRIMINRDIVLEPYGG